MLPDFIQIPSILIGDKDLNPLDGIVYGIVYWYSKLKLQKCLATNKQIALILHAHHLTVSRSIQKLIEKRYLVSRIDRENGNKRELIPTVTYKPRSIDPILKDIDPIDSEIYTSIQNDENSLPQIGTPNKNTEEEDSNKKKTLTKVNVKNSEEIDFHEKTTGQQINLLLDLFKNINPSYEKLFANKGQRTALEKLLTKYGYEKIKNVISLLPETNEQPYAPNITTPVQLEAKLGNLVVFLRQEQNKKGGVVRVQYSS